MFWSLLVLLFIYSKDTRDALANRRKAPASVCQGNCVATRLQRRRLAIRASQRTNRWHRVLSRLSRRLVCSRSGPLSRWVWSWRSSAVSRMSWRQDLARTVAVLVRSGSSWMCGTLQRGTPKARPEGGAAFDGRFWDSQASWVGRPRKNRSTALL